MTKCKFLGERSSRDAMSNEQTEWDLFSGIVSALALETVTSKPVSVFHIAREPRGN
jgi:hypothetical protein